MFTAYATVTIVTIVFNAWAAIADFLKADFVLANGVQLGIPQSWLPTLGALKAAGAVGLLLGLLGAPWVGIAAAIGLVLFFVGAIVVHFRARVYLKTLIPGWFLGLAIASLVLAFQQ
ncbi:DoxX family protein [Nonomuraea diastatica]|uniref:DoxX family protein n=1 Tax=Nonomuraea diastatica TaxID=1848329 RepID=A0A4R4X2T3_9ACTN|nr:DoxX family protein [Nonomuraea diastatica]TDD24475.1 DoxX family protein [Nonomuraea diastatica]